MCNSNDKCSHGRVFDESVELKGNAMLKVRPDLWHEWDFDKNDELGLDIYEMTKGQHIKAWWNCKEGHKMESAIYNRVKGSGCVYCSGQKAWVGESDMWTTNPIQASMLLNPEDGYRFMEQSNQKVKWKCPSCDEIVSCVISDVNNQGLPCPRCSDGFSFPEKVMYNLLKELRIEFKHQKTFEWSNNKRYDFYIPSLSLIIETHGRQHSTDGFGYKGGKTVTEEQANDSYKYDLALQNEIKQYITIDCRKSKFDFIKVNILNSKMTNFFNFDNIDWNKVEIASHKSIVKEVAGLWSKGMSIKEILEFSGLSYDSVRSSLINGTKTGLCDYNKKESHMRGNSIFNKKIVKLDVEGNYMCCYDSIKEASNGTASAKVGIYNVCNGRAKTSRGYKWMYKEDYDKHIK